MVFVSGVKLIGGVRNAHWHTGREA